MKRFSEKLTVILFCAAIAAFAAAFLILPGRVFSEQENRRLAQAPEPELESVLNGDFADDTNEWFADQFPLPGQP